VISHPLLVSEKSSDQMRSPCGSTRNVGSDSRVDVPGSEVSIFGLIVDDDLVAVENVTGGWVSIGSLVLDVGLHAVLNTRINKNNGRYLFMGSPQIGKCQTAHKGSGVTSSLHRLMKKRMGNFLQSTPKQGSKIARNFRFI